MTVRRTMRVMYITKDDLSDDRVDMLLVRRVAVDAVADPRTVLRVVQGARVRGQVGARIRARLANLDLPSALRLWGDNA